MSYFRLYITIIRGKPSIILLLIILLTALGYLALSAIGYIRALYYVNSVFTGIKEGIVISSYAISPFTSVIDSREINQLTKDIEDIDIEYYLVTIAYIYERPVIVRSTEESLDKNCVYLGKDIALETNINKGIIAPVYSPFTKKTLFFEVCGLINEPILIVPYERAVEIRGINPGYYSFAVVKTTNETALKELYRSMGLEPSEYKLLTRALLILTRRGAELSINIFEDYAEGYMYRLGIYRDLVFYFAYAVSVISLLSIPIIGMGLVFLFHREIYVLLLAGLPRGKILQLLLTPLITSIILSCLFMFLISILELYPSINILAYSIKPVVELRDFIYVYSAQLGLSFTGLFYGLSKYV